MEWLTLFVVLLLLVLRKTMIIVPNSMNFVRERLGQFNGVLQPGFHFMVPFLDRVRYRHDMREQVIDVPPQMCITRDNIQVSVDGLVYLKIFDAEKASYGIEDYRRASINLAQTTMRSEIGKLTLDSTFSERETLNENIVREIDKASDPWGVKVLRYEIKNISPSPKVIETLEKQMEAERYKRAEVLMANAEKESRINLSEGERQENINLSEGRREQLINQAEGRAQELTLQAEATAKGIRRVAEALRKPGGAEAVRMQVVQQYIREFGKIVAESDVSVVPAELARVEGFFEGLGGVAEGLSRPSTRSEGR